MIIVVVVVFYCVFKYNIHKIHIINIAAEVIKTFKAAGEYS